MFSDALCVFAFDGYDIFVVLQSSLHEYWARKYSFYPRTRLRYSPSTCFETYPFPQEDQSRMTVLEESVSDTTAHRQGLMQQLQLGLTKLYNLFHDPDLDVEGLQKAAAVELDEAAAEEAMADLQRLRDLHREMDEAVRDAYGWNDLDLGHGFHEVDFLPENDRVRYTISPKARKQVLRRLLLLNHERHAEEEAAKKGEQAPV